MLLREEWKILECLAMGFMRNQRNLPKDFISCPTEKHMLCVLREKIRLVKVAGQGGVCVCVEGDKI